jgi:transcription elongation factor GreA
MGGWQRQFKIEFTHSPKRDSAGQLHCPFVFTPSIREVFMATSTYPITKIGAEKLKAELLNLKMKERPAVIMAISEARAQGDLSENADYDAAKERQGFIEGRIKDIEGKLGAASVIVPSELDAGGRVVFGATIELEDEDTGASIKYQIVGEDEADIKLGLVNFSSPIARALIGKNEGDSVDVVTPSGTKHYEIVAVQYI